MNEPLSIPPTSVTPTSPHLTLSPVVATYDIYVYVGIFLRLLLLQS